MNGTHSLVFFKDNDIKKTCPSLKPWMRESFASRKQIRKCSFLIHQKAFPLRGKAFTLELTSYLQNDCYKSFYRLAPYHHFPAMMVAGSHRACPSFLLGIRVSVQIIILYKM